MDRNDIIKANAARVDYYAEVIDFSGADFSGADLRNINVGRFNFAGANFAGAKLFGSRFLQCDFSGADLQGIGATGPESEITGSFYSPNVPKRTGDIQFLVFAGSNLSKAKFDPDFFFHDREIDGCNLAGATYGGIKHFPSAIIDGPDRRNVFDQIAEIENTSVDQLVHRWGKWLDEAYLITRLSSGEWLVEPRKPSPIEIYLVVQVPVLMCWPRDVIRVSAIDEDGLCTGELVYSPNETEPIGTVRFYADPRDYREFPSLEEARDSGNQTSGEFNPEDMMI